MQTIVEAGGELLESVDLVDVYRGEQVGDGPQEPRVPPDVPRAGPHPARRKRRTRRARAAIAAPAANATAPRSASRMDGRDDAFTTGDRYEPYIGRWSRLVAREFLTWLAVPAEKDWLDVGCGTGALTQVILEMSDPRPSVASIRRPGSSTTRAIGRPSQRASFDVGDAQAIPVDDASVDARSRGWSSISCPTVRAVAAEMARVVRPGGVVAAYVWDYAGKMELMRLFWYAAVELDPEASELDEGPRFPICAPKALADLFEGGRAARRRGTSDRRPLALRVTSTTTGRRSSAGRVRRPPMRCRSARTIARLSATASARGFPSRTMAPSTSCHERGRFGGPANRRGSASTGAGCRSSSRCFRFRRCRWRHPSRSLDRSRCSLRLRSRGTRYRSPRCR